jgi:hypothetical protein
MADLTSLEQTLWSTKLKMAFEAQASYAKAINYDWQSEMVLKKGKTIEINAVTGVVMEPYTGAEIDTDTDDLTSEAVELVIDKEYQLHFKVKDYDQANIFVNLTDEGIKLAGPKVRAAIETAIAAEYANVLAGNVIGTTIAPIEPDLTTIKVYDTLVDAGTLLDENNVPDTDRAVILPPWVYAFLQKDDRFIAKSTPTSESVLSTGFVGEAAGFAIFKSNAVAVDGTTWKAMAMHRTAVSMAMYLDKMIVSPMEKEFATLYKELVLFGIKTVYPESMVVVTFGKA